MPCQYSGLARPLLTVLLQWRPKYWERVCNGYKSVQHGDQHGQALLDIVIGTGVFLILVHAIFSLVTVVYDSLGYTRTRLSARHIANEKMEELSNLSYDDLGTIGGIPNGVIEQFQTVNHNGLDFTVHTTIAYMDDPFDGITPNDLLPTDYKQVRVAVTWGGRYNSRVQPVVMVSNIAPQGIETSVGGGTLSIFVIDAQALPLIAAGVHVVNTEVVPTIDIQLQTNSTGRVILPGAPACATCYQVTVTKTGFTTDRTYATTEVTNPHKRHVTIAEGALSETTFIIDQVSKLTLNSKTNRESGFAIYPQSTVRITGNKTIGTDSQDQPIYKFDQLVTTDIGGNATISNLEWDSYLITIPATQSAHISGINPFLPITINPDDDLTVQYTVSPATAHALLLDIHDASNSAIASASAQLNLGTTLIASGSSGLAENPDFGQLFFDNLQSTTYEFTISSVGFMRKYGTIPVSDYTTDIILLQAQ